MNYDCIVVDEKTNTIVVVGDVLCPRRRHILHGKGALKNAVEIPRRVFMDAVRKLVAEEMIDKEI